MMAFGPLTTVNANTRSVIAQINRSLMEIKNNFAIGLTLGDRPNSYIRYETYINENDDYVYVFDGQKWFRYHHALRKGILQSDIDAVTNRINRLENLITAGITQGPRGPVGPPGDKGPDGEVGPPGPIEKGGVETGSGDRDETNTNTPDETPTAPPTPQDPTPSQFVLWATNSATVFAFNPRNRDGGFHTHILDNETLSSTIEQGDQVQFTIEMTFADNTSLTWRSEGIIGSSPISPLVYRDIETWVDNEDNPTKIGNYRVELKFNRTLNRHVFDFQYTQLTSGTVRIKYSLFFKKND